ncbi:SpoVR family protein [Lichenihabitans sp. PAMC28606]|uniref:SpoVR family protein n=1 Tax=Lichenihabitans sp. PAMC28606 TaxID=2880932 RepID=UPI001D0A9372|nr:SpoVR family protein [Lichenihabitans sp. PAMC28606]UDL95041.1 SpoVR family protein [Lichenihabitans sp. PAMC28606]
MTLIQTNRLLYDGTDWTFDTIRRIHDAVAEIAHKDLGLSTYANQIEVITAEQMLDAYASTGMPQLYKHWSFGKHFAQHETGYRHGYMGLAYEIVINSDPCISYIMEENSATMQCLVIAHAAFGHNHFFKNNYLFQQWTDAEGILDYLTFAKRYIAECEERYGQAAVERVLDAAHALQAQGVHRYPRKKPLNLMSEELRERDRERQREEMFNDLWRTVPSKTAPSGKDLSESRRRAMLDLPQENLLHFLEKSAPRLRPWQREILRIVRLVAQYFYPQRQTKVMNEGCATYCHYQIMSRLHANGQITDGSFLEFLQSHTNVVRQPTFESQHYNGINPYALGFDMMSDIERIVTEPSEEDREWFPDLAGTGDVMAVLRDTWANYRDESFITQFMSPRLIRNWRLFHIADHPDEEDLKVAAIHNERGYRALRRSLARQYDVAWTDPDIQVIDVDLAGDRKLIVHHNVLDGILLQPGDCRSVLQHLADLWGYGVILREVEEASGTVLAEHQASPRTGVA